MGKGGDFHPEDRSNEADWVSKSGNIRCKRVRKNGKRCERWAVKGYNYCPFHGAPRSRERRNMDYAFKTEAAAEIFERARNDPDYQSVRGELALIRTATQLFVDHADAVAKKGGTLKPKHVAYMAQMAQDAAKVAEACNRIEKGLTLHVSVEALDAFIGQFMGIVMDVVKDDETVSELQRRIDELGIPTQRRDLREGREDDAE